VALYIELISSNGARVPRCGAPASSAVRSGNAPHRMCEWYVCITSRYTRRSSSLQPLSGRLDIGAHYEYRGGTRQTEAMHVPDKASPSCYGQVHNTCTLFVGETQQAACVITPCSEHSCRTCCTRERQNPHLASVSPVTAASTSASCCGQWPCSSPASSTLTALPTCSQAQNLLSNLLV